MSMDRECIEELANEILEWLKENSLWVDCRIYFNGMAYSTDDRDGSYTSGRINDVHIIKDINPRDYFDYAGDILSMSFEGPLYEVFNGYAGHISTKLCHEFSSILSEYGLYYELGNAWNLSVYPNE